VYYCNSQLALRIQRFLDFKQETLERYARLSSGYRQPIHAVYYRNSQFVLRIQCFLDFMQEKLERYAR
jgi:hypothetical protein